MLQAYEAGKTKVQLGDNKNVFDFSYVGNVAQAYILAAKHLVHAHEQQQALPTDKRVEGEAFFVTNDEPYHFWDFARAVWTVAGDTTKVENVWVIPKAPGLVLASIIEWVI